MSLGQQTPAAVNVDVQCRGVYVCLRVTHFKYVDCPLEQHLAEHPGFIRCHLHLVVMTTVVKSLL